MVAVAPSKDHGFPHTWSHVFSGRQRALISQEWTKGVLVGAQLMIHEIFS